MGLRFGIRGPGSGIWDLEKPIPDPEVKKAADSGSGSATLLVRKKGVVLYPDFYPHLAAVSIHEKLPLISWERNTEYFFTK
jgi:hypothetical protein